jgi:hypothetical protein
MPERDARDRTRAGSFADRAFVPSTRRVASIRSLHKAASKRGTARFVCHIDFHAMHGDWCAAMGQELAI